jgi:hypothetical protein
LVRISTVDAQIWVCKLKRKNVLQFEYKDLPEELKNKALLYRAKEEGLIIGIGKNGNGRRLWRISDNIKCKYDNDKNLSFQSS